MEKNSSENEYYIIDIMQILRKMLKKLWLIILVALIGGAVAFSYSKFYLTPKYSSSVMLYVNNSSISLGGTSLSIGNSELNAAQGLVRTYMAILKNRTTYQEVAEKCNDKYSWKQISNMVSTKQVDETPVMSVTVTTVDPYDAAKIANAIAEVLPERIAAVIKGSTMEIVDSAEVSLGKVSPSNTKNTAIGFAIGAIIAMAFIALSVILDTTIHDEEYFIQNYKFPILATIPDFNGKDASGNYYYNKYGYKYGYGYGEKK